MKLILLIFFTTSVYAVPLIGQVSSGIQNHMRDELGLDKQYVEVNKNGY